MEHMDWGLMYNRIEHDTLFTLTTQLFLESTPITKGNEI